MQKNLYYRSVFKRQNVIKDFFLGTFASLSSYPKMILEVFIRKNFGERYFSLASAITIAILLIFYPIGAYRISSMRSAYMGDGNSSFWGSYATWYVFTLTFLYTSILRWKEVRRNPSVFNSERFSKYSGDIKPFFFSLPGLKGKPTLRQIEIFYEPALFLVIGLLLWLMGQSIGALFFVSSIFYSLSYAYAYKTGDDLVMDVFDEIILNKEMKKSFTKDTHESEARGVRYYMRKPNSEEAREEFLDAIIEEDEDVAVAM